jgi:hypothetical protein
MVTISLFLFAGNALTQDPGQPPGDRPPPDAFSRIEDAGAAADHDGADYVIVYDYAINRMKPSGVTYVETEMIYKVLTPAGCRDRSVLRWNYDPQSSYVDVQGVNIIRDGKRIAVDVSRVHDLPAPQAWIYWKDRIKTLQLPRLRVNDGIEIKTFRKGFTYALLSDDTRDGGSSAAGLQTSSQAPSDDRYIPPMPGEYFDIVLFADAVPVIEKRYVLSLPSDKRLHSEVYNGPLYSGTTYTEDRTEYSWWGLDLPPSPRETRQPARSDYVAKVVMATAESWEAKSRWFFDVNRDQFEVTPDIHAPPRHDDLRTAERRVQGYRRHADHDDARRRYEQLRGDDDGGQPDRSGARRSVQSLRLRATEGGRIVCDVRPDLGTVQQQHLVAPRSGATLSDWHP